MQSPAPEGTEHHGPSFTGRTAIDEHGDQLGEIADVVFDQHYGRPEYLVVKPGVFRSSHYVPVEGIYETIEGEIVVPWDRHWFKLAPKAQRSHALSSEQRHDLEAHYAHH